MSAIKVTRQHIDYLISAAVLYDCAQRFTPQQMAMMLETENNRSLEERYPNEIHGVASNREPILLCSVDPVVVLKSIEFYAYQSCEGIERWNASEAKKWCHNLRLHAIGKLPGYDKAPWGIG